MGVRGAQFAPPPRRRKLPASVLTLLSMLPPLETSLALANFVEKVLSRAFREPDTLQHEQRRVYCGQCVASAATSEFGS